MAVVINSSLHSGFSSVIIFKNYGSLVRTETGGIEVDYLLENITVSGKIYPIENHFTV